MKHAYFRVALLLSFIYVPLSHADATITLFLRLYPAHEDGQFATEISTSLRNPGKIAHYTVHGILQKDWNSGIFATYGGFLSSSDSNGELMFPRRHEKPQVHLVVTDRATPIMMAGNTIHHWEFEPETHAQMFAMEQKKDMDTQLSYWDVRKVEIPDNNVIPYDAVIIFANPKDMYVPTGVTVVKPQPNLVLPDVYVKKGIKIYPTTLYVLNLRHFYGPIRFMYEKRPSSYSSLINP